MVKFRYLGVFALVLVCHGAALAFAWLNVQPPKSLTTSVKAEQPPALTGLLVAPAAVQTPPAKPVQPQPRLTPKQMNKSRNSSSQSKHSHRHKTPTQAARPVAAKPLPSGPESARAISQLASASATPATSKPATKQHNEQTALQLPSTAATSAQNQAPLYPKISRKRKEQGTVLLLLLVSKLGKVESIQIKRSSGFSRLDQAALQAVKQWRFTAASQNGQAIDYWYEMPINFSLNQTQ